MNRLEEAREAFSDVCLVPPARSEEFDPDGYWRIAQPHHLTRRTSAILRELYIAREHLARDKDTPPFKIMLDKILIAVAQAAPSSLSDLAEIDSMSPTLVRRYGRILIEAVAAGMRAKVPLPPPPDPPADPVVVERYTALREWRKARALERGVESDVIISKDALWTLAERAPDSLDEMDDVRGLGPWRLGVYGVEILEVIRRYRR